MRAASKHIHWQETKISDTHLGYWFYADTKENNKSKSFHWKQSHIMIAKIKKINNRMLTIFMLFQIWFIYFWDLQIKGQNKEKKTGLTRKLGMIFNLHFIKRRNYIFSH